MRQLRHRIGGNYERPCGDGEAVDPGDRASSMAVYEGCVRFHAIIINFRLLFVRYYCKSCFAIVVSFVSRVAEESGYTGGNICIYSSLVSSCISSIKLLILLWPPPTGSIRSLPVTFTTEAATRSRCGKGGKG